MRHFLIVLWIFCTPFILLAQFKTQTASTKISDQLRSGSGVSQSLAGLIGLDPSRLHISHSYQLSYMSIGGGLTQGMYLNTLSYQFSVPLTLSLQWGIAYQPLQSVNAAPFLANGPFISAAQLRYQAKNNLSIELNFQNDPNPYFYNPFYNRYYRGGFGY
jgi:hypothetical protein